MRLITSAANGNLQVFVKASTYTVSLGIEIVPSRLVSIHFKDSVMDVYIHSAMCTRNSSLRFEQVTAAAKMDDD